MIAAPVPRGTILARGNAWTQQCWVSINNRVCDGGRMAARMSHERGGARRRWGRARDATAAARDAVPSCVSCGVYLGCCRCCRICSFVACSSTRPSSRVIAAVAASASPGCSSDVAPRVRRRYNRCDTPRTFSRVLRLGVP